MLKSNGRETMIFLLGGLAALGGFNLTSGKQPSLPKDCDWLPFPYKPIDLVPLLEREKSMRELGVEGRVLPYGLKGLFPADLPASRSRDSR